MGKKMERKHKLICFAWILTILCFLAIRYILWECDRQTQELEKQRQELSQSYWGFGEWIYQAEIVETHLEIIKMNWNSLYYTIAILIAVSYVVNDIILKM